MIITYSTINSYLICPYKVKHERDNQLHSISWPMAASNAGHKALDAWAKGEDWQQAYENRMTEYLNRQIDEANWNTLFTNPSDYVVQKDVVRELLEKYIAKTVTRPDVSELNLSREVADGIVLKGRVDAAWHGRIVDWKFTSHPGYLTKLQAICYAILNGGGPFEFHGLIKARSPYCEVFPVPEADDKEYRQRVIDNIIIPVANAIEQGVWFARPTDFLCNSKYCGYWDICEGKME